MSALPTHQGRRLLADIVKRRDLAPGHPGHIRLILDAPWIADQARPGQFVHVLPPSSDLMLRRPFSLLSADPSSGLITILFRVIGDGTRLLADASEGESLDIIGPLGNGFPVDAEHPAVLVGGGVGIPPLAFLAEQLPDIGVFLGAKDQATLICVEDLVALGAEPVLATEDGSIGVHGLVTDALAEASLMPETTVYACGPIPMLKAIAAWSADNGFICYVSLENKLGCGIGACLGCSIPIREKDGTIHYERVCCDGPVFDASRVAFDLM